MAWTNWITLGDEHVNSFGSYSQFWLLTEYQYNRSGNTVYYNIKLTLRYHNTQNGSANYPRATGVKMEFNYEGDPGYTQVDTGGNYSSSASNPYTTVGNPKPYEKSIQNTTGSGTVPIRVAADRLDGADHFDNPGWYYYNLTIPQMDSYTIAYYSNGGTGAPSNQTKQHGVAITLSTTTPSRGSSTVTGYTVTYNANGGTIIGNSTAQNNKIETYSFNTWNTNSSGTGSNYAPGSTYSTNANLNLYAKWTVASTTYTNVILPGGYRNGYVLAGWSTDSSATSPDTGKTVGANFAPTANVTLYAVWQQKDVVLKLAPEIYDLIYPIGSYYTSFDNTNPTDKFGGNWTLVESGYDIKQVGSMNIYSGINGSGLVSKTNLIGAYNYQLIDGLFYIPSGSSSVEIPTPDGYHRAYRLFFQGSTGGGAQITMYLNNIATTILTTWSASTYRKISATDFFQESDIVLEPTMGYANNGINLKYQISSTASTWQIFDVIICGYFVSDEVRYTWRRTA